MLRVTDNGTPPLSDTGTFSVTVLPAPHLGVAEADGNLLHLSFSTSLNQVYQLEYKDNLEDPVWTRLVSSADRHRHPVGNKR